MKTKILLLVLGIILTASLMLTGGCGHQPVLSAMTDQEIRDKIDELYAETLPSSIGNTYYEYWSWIASIIQVYQNELILRQLEGKGFKEEIDKLDGKGLNEK